MFLVCTSLTDQNYLCLSPILKFFYRVLDRPGLLTTDTQNLRPGQENFVRDAEEVAEWTKGETGIELLEVVKRAKPTMLIGCSTAANSFNEQVGHSCALFAMYAWLIERFGEEGHQGDGKAC